MRDQREGGRGRRTAPAEGRHLLVGVDQDLGQLLGDAALPVADLDIMQERRDPRCRTSGL